MEILGSSEHGSPITSTFELIGQFLMFKSFNVDQVTQCNLFLDWLKNRGVHHRKNDIVEAVAMKCNILFPGIYDESIYKKSE
jgi:hypothetical protein